MSRGVFDMEKLRLYIETSVWSHWYADDTPERRDETRRFFSQCVARGEEVELLASLTVLEEIERAQEDKRRKLRLLVQQYHPTIVRPDLATFELARAYMAHGAIPPSKVEDAVHAAIATIVEADVLVSWNYRHLVNYQREQRINGISTFMGYNRGIRITTPAEVFADEVQSGTT